ncbi:cation:proton antiporter [Desulfoferrobacter suflitae]|uniref:cation:proton antiporter n=1 Tax=Desulfoferrobacter suflitae TaxID=2865782 RepID=UPI0021646EF3|nr:cation:proton antiporter [Desulfoferrobacter suflitae]MCK8601800.1 cation:proton antiporter [Desulfoferrobacter suflitae]
MLKLPFLLLAGLILCTFFLVSFTSQKLRYPSVLVYIALGVAIAVFFPESKAIHITGEIGIVLLFFILGLEFPLARMMEISRNIWSAGLLDVVLNLGGAAGLALLFGLSPMAALVLGAVAYATSSSISAKMLEEQKRLANPETEFILALLIFEDLVAPVLVSFIAGAQNGDEMSLGFVALLFLKIVLLMVGAILIGHYAFRRLDNFIARHLERDFMALLTTGIALAYAGVAMVLGLSEILGAFLAGMMLSETGRSSEVEHLMLPVRDITLPFFFFWFGTTISLGEGVPFIPLMVLLVVWAVVGKVLTGFVGGRLFGLSRKVSCRAAFSLVQRGEFSAIIASLAIPQLRIFSGIYILVTAFIGVFLFQRASRIAGWYQQNWLKPAGKPSQSAGD